MSESLAPGVVIDISKLEPSSGSTEALHPVQAKPIRYRFQSSVFLKINDFLVNSKPRKSIQNFLNQQQWNHSLLETYINRSYYLGLSPFRISFHSETCSPTFKSLTAPKIIFVVWNIFAFLHDLCQLRLLTLSYDQYKRHPKLVYVFLGYRATLTYMQFRYFQLLWWKRYKFSRLLESFRNAELITVRPSWTSLFPTFIILTSLLFSLICVIGGFNQLTDAASWSPWHVLTRYKNDLCIAALGMFANDVTILTITNEFIPTLIIGVLGAFIDLVTELLHFSVVDIFFLSAVTIWMLARELEVEHVSPHMYGTLHRQQKQVVTISREINEIVKLFLPPLTTATIISFTYVIHLVLQQKWFMAFYVAVKLTKPCVAYILALKITAKVSDFNYWFFSPHVQQELGLDTRELQIKVLEINDLPIGLGQGAFHVNVRFMASFIGIISTYFFLIREGFGFDSSDTL